MEFDDAARSSQPASPYQRRGQPPKSSPVITSGYIWAGADQIGWIKDGEVFSVATNEKIGTLDQAGNLFSPDGQPLNLHLETVNGGGRIGAESSANAIARFKNLADGR